MDIQQSALQVLKFPNAETLKLTLAHSSHHHHSTTLKVVTVPKGPTAYTISECRQSSIRLDTCISLGAAKPQAKRTVVYKAAPPWNDTRTCHGALASSYADSEIDSYIAMKKTEALRRYRDKFFFLPAPTNYKAPPAPAKMPVDKAATTRQVTIGRRSVSVMGSTAP